MYLENLMLVRSDQSLSNLSAYQGKLLLEFVKFKIHLSF